MDLDNIVRSPAFAGMRALPQWIVWKLEPDEVRPGKMAKRPKDRRTEHTTSALDASNWSSPQQAIDDARRMGPGHGAGFVFTEGCGYWFLDLDSCYDGAAWSAFATAAVTQYFPNAALEVSSSGRGLHLFGRGAVPPHSSKCAQHGAEFYTSGRFAAMTGIQARGGCDTDHTAMLGWFVPAYFPPRSSGGADLPDDGPRADWNGPTDNVELLRRMMQSKSAAGVFGGRATCADLYHADVAKLSVAYPPDPGSSEPFDRSSADAALFQHAAFWTGCDRRRMLEVVQGSALKRDKWDREDYIERTITFACSMQRDVLQDKRSEPGPSAPTANDAPAMRAVEGATFLTAEAQAELFKGCIYVEDTHRVLVPGGLLLKPEQFVVRFGGYTFAMDARNERTVRKAFEAFTESQVLRPPKADGTCFRPDLPYGAIVRDPGRTRANTYWPVEVPRVKGDVTPFLTHLTKLLPNQRDALITLYMLAALVQHQGIKFQWAIVLQGVEGNGKTLFSRCVAEAIGRRYVHWPKASKLNAKFNGWMVGKTFYAVEDIHAGDKHDTIEELKPMITGGDGLEIEGKGVDQISAEICGNFLFNTNHKTGIRKTRNDRRFCWMATAQQEFAHLARDGMGAEYMTRLYDWLKKEDGYAIVAEYLWTLPIPDEFNPATGCQRAPVTSSTEAAVEAGMGRIEQEIVAAAERGDPGFADGWASTTMLDRLLERLHVSREVLPNARGPMLEALGYVRHPGLATTAGQVHHPILPDNAKPRLYVRHGHASLTITKPADIGRAYTQAQAPGYIGQ